jgi:predicted RNase H-like nuclease
VASVAGVDGCRTGWVVATEAGADVVPTFAGVIAAVPDDSIIAVDIPIGLEETYSRGGRECDRHARKLLGRLRGSSVFPAPPRPALGCLIRSTVGKTAVAARDLAAARARGWPATLQGLNILPKIEEVDAVMTPVLQTRVFEAHPELCFLALNGGRPLLHNKRVRAGRDQRWALLEAAGIARHPRPQRGEAEDDLIDACAELWIARRIARGEAVRVPHDPPHDARGLRMEIWG